MTAINADKLIQDLKKDLRYGDGRFLGHCSADNMRVILDVLTASEAEVERLRKGLERLASPEAFETSRMSTPEERARMFYAASVLAGSSQP